MGEEKKDTDFAQVNEIVGIIRKTKGKGSAQKVKKQSV